MNTANIYDVTQIAQIKWHLHLIENLTLSHLLIFFFLFYFIFSLSLSISLVRIGTVNHPDSTPGMHLISNHSVSKRNPNERNNMKKSISRHCAASISMSRIFKE